MQLSRPIILHVSKSLLLLQLRYTNTTSPKVETHLPTSVGSCWLMSVRYVGSCWPVCSETRHDGLSFVDRQCGLVCLDFYEFSANAVFSSVCVRPAIHISKCVLA